MGSGGPMDLHYLAATAADRNPRLSEPSRKRFRHNVNRWVRLGGPLYPGDITPAVVTQVRRAGLLAKLAAASIESTITDIRALCLAVGVELDTGKPLRRTKPTPDVPTVEQVAAIYSAADAAQWPRVASSRGGRRCDWLQCSGGDWWRAWIVVAAWWGFRLRDIGRLTWEDVRSGSRTANKTGKRHPLVALPLVGRHIERLGTTSGPVFGRQSVAQLRRELARIADSAGVAYVPPHCFRRYAVTQWSLVSPDAGRLIHGAGLGILDHYVSAGRILELADIVTVCGCGHQIVAPASQAGLRVKCPRCRGSVQLPT